MTGCGAPTAGCLLEASAPPSVAGLTEAEGDGSPARQWPGQDSDGGEVAAASRGTLGSVALAAGRYAYQRFLNGGLSRAAGHSPRPLTSGPAGPSPGLSPATRRPRFNHRFHAPPRRQPARSLPPPYPYLRPLLLASVAFCSPVPLPFPLLPSGSSPVPRDTRSTPAPLAPVPRASRQPTTTAHHLMSFSWCVGVVGCRDAVPSAQASGAGVDRCPRLSPRSRPPPTRSLAGLPRRPTCSGSAPRCGSQGRFAPDPRRGLTAAARGALVWVGRRAEEGVLRTDTIG